ncbi:BZ3500_MvSof-1268-A1-R1_Chr9g10611 [Microbotryum saponariae]|uniref:BZ3500_MvSof-1268-A1-R1_Chr9g10611 protein n=1 Tax=Microbotryum saponariae TaxID=289078 RepID=A0A2X0KUE5_9BASI|nr:BZ3501_MvSof-1269-A2-R1_Chr9g10359 [Microbotryum saponariae]SDA00385.1 BZ3500_MvSof-1268-A1-R1_Chr9g10611 [Microbotryum saponariae]
MQQPAMLYGTAWKGARTTALVVQAVLAGFRGIDTACQPKHYRQELVGQAIEQLKTRHGINRDQLWIQTKFTSLDGQDLSQPLPYDKGAPLAQQVRQSFETSLKQLGTDYVDSLIMHAPMRTREETRSVWTEFESLVKSGKVREIGISNIYDVDLFDWCFGTFEIKPSSIQNRFVEEHLNFCTPILERLTQRVKEAQSPSSIWPEIHFKSDPSPPPPILDPQILRQLSLPQALTFSESRTRLRTAAQILYYLLMTTRRWPKGMIIPLTGTTSEQHVQDDIEVMRAVEESSVGDGWKGEKREMEDARKLVEKYIWSDYFTAAV